METTLDQRLQDAADPASGYVPPACPFPGPHGHLGQTNLSLQTGFQVVCNVHLDQALLTVGPPTAVRGQGQPRCSGCDSSGPTLPGANPFDIAGSFPTLRTFGLAEVPQVRACTAHLLRALTDLLAAS